MTLSLPAFRLKEELDGVKPRATTEKIATKFTSPFEWTGLPGVGHFQATKEPTRSPHSRSGHLRGEFGNRGKASEIA